MNKQFKSKLVLLTVFTVAIILPLLTLFLNINLSEVSALVASEHFVSLIINSLTTTLLATLISVTLAIAVAWAINRANIKFKNMFTVLLTVPMLIPSISHAIGLIILLGTNGLITNLFNFEFALFGFNGIVIGSILYSFPVAFLLLNDAFSYEDFTVYEAANVLGLSPMAQFKEITLPNIKEVAKPNQKMLVQIQKDSNDKKGARTSTHIKLTGKYVILMPNTNIVTISQKVADEKERERLLNIIKSLYSKKLALS